MKRNPPPKRDWTDARAKVDAEGVCRACGKQPPEVRLETAHVVGREHDERHTCGRCEGGGCASCNGHGWFQYVHPDDVVPLCGPATSTGTCHGKQHAHRLDMLPILTVEEQARAVRHHGGIAMAYRVLSGQGIKEAVAPQRVPEWHVGQVFPPTPPPPPRG